MSIRILPVALLKQPPVHIYPFRRPFLTWNERVKKAREAGIVAVEVKGEAKLFWKNSGSPVGPEQLYFENEEEAVQRARLPECRTRPKGPLLDVVAVKRALQRVPMSFFTATSKARMGAKRCTRRIITLRVKAALNLIVTRGAYYGEASEKNAGYVGEVCDESGRALPTMKFDKEEAVSMGRTWILQGLFSNSGLIPSPSLITLIGWSYIFAPTVEVYRMPYSKLIPILRQALTTLKDQAIEMENKWLALSLLREQRMALKAKTLVLQSPQQIVVEKEAVPTRVSQHSGTATPRGARRQTSTNDKPSSFGGVAWKRNLEEEMQLLAQISSVKS